MSDDRQLIVGGDLICWEQRKSIASYRYYKGDDRSVLDRGIETIRRTKEEHLKDCATCHHVYAELTHEEWVEFIGRQERTHP